MDRDPKGEGTPAACGPGGRAFQAEGTVGAKLYGGTVLTCLSHRTKASRAGTESGRYRRRES